MTFLWPSVLWLLIALPVLVGLYLVLLRRRKRFAIRFPNLALVASALGPAHQIRRHLPPFLLLLGLIATVVAIARPSAVVTLPYAQRTLIMAIDVSLSMEASDIQPNRLAAAKKAAKAFVKQQPTDVRIGLVAFGGSAVLVQRPTRNQDDLIAAIELLELRRATAIGSGMILSLAALFPQNEAEFHGMLSDGSSSASAKRGLALGATELKPETKIVPPGSDPSRAIVLLTDGRCTTGPDPLDVARLAADHGVRVFTVGFGDGKGTTVQIGGYPMFMAFDEPTLKSIAEITRADFFRAASADELMKVYDTLASRLVLERRQTELTALLVALSAILVLCAGTLSMLWLRGIP